MSTLTTFAYSEDPDEMQHIMLLYAAFHQDLHCKDKKDLQTKEYSIILN